MKNLLISLFGIILASTASVPAAEAFYPYFNNGYGFGVPSYGSAGTPYYFSSKVSGSMTGFASGPNGLVIGSMTVRHAVPFGGGTNYVNGIARGPDATLVLSTNSEVTVTGVGSPFFSHFQPVAFRRGW
jgi:phage-related protein